jgi:hypothetical protein
MAGIVWREGSAEARILKLRVRQFMTQMSVSRLRNCDKMPWQAVEAGAEPEMRGWPEDGDAFS